MYMQLMINLGLVLLLILVFTYIAWKFKLNKYKKSDLIKIVSYCQVGPKEKVMLIELDKTKLLIGVTSHNITRLNVGSIKESAAESQVNESFEEIMDQTSNKDVNKDALYGV